MMRWRKTSASHWARENRYSAVSGSRSCAPRRWREASLCDFGDDRAGFAIGIQRALDEGESNLPQRLRTEEALLIGVLGHVRVHRPSGELLMPSEPDVRKLLQVPHHFFEGGGDHGPSPEMAMQCQDEHRHRLGAVKIVERSFVDVP